MLSGNLWATRKASLSEVIDRAAPSDGPQNHHPARAAMRMASLPRSGSDRRSGGGNFWFENFFREIANCVTIRNVRSSGSRAGRRKVDL